jgi:hypothetical protein
MDNETFLIDNGKKFGGDAISYHRFFRAGAFFIAQSL